MSDPLLAALSRPETLAGLDLAGWDTLLRQARRTRLVARIDALARRAGVFDAFPARVRANLAGARMVAADHRRMLRWEMNRIARALAGIDAPVVLLKGAAYVAAALPLAEGRLVSDVDILLPRARIDAVEAALRRHGWEPAKRHPYDQRYYRRWMHELPPLRHRERKTVVDAHHAILPPTSRLKPDPEALLAAARPLAGSPFRVLAPADMALHAAAHLFHDGEIAFALRDLADIDAMLRDFGRDDAFWKALTARAERLDLGRPLYYALRFCRKLLATPVPAETVAAAAAFAPPAPVRALMDRLTPLALLPEKPGAETRAAAAARFALYVRAHWLRMPPPLLAAHLSRKATMRLAGRGGKGETRTA